MLSSGEVCQQLGVAPGMPLENISSLVVRQSKALHFTGAFRAAPNCKAASCARASQGLRRSRTRLPCHLVSMSFAIVGVQGLRLSGPSGSAHVVALQWKPGTMCFLAGPMHPEWPRYGATKSSNCVFHRLTLLPEVHRQECCAAEKTLPIAEPIPRPCSTCSSLYEAERRDWKLLWSPSDLLKAQVPRFNPGIRFAVSCSWAEASANLLGDRGQHHGLAARHCTFSKLLFGVMGRLGLRTCAVTLAF